MREDDTRGPSTHTVTVNLAQAATLLNLTRWVVVGYFSSVGFFRPINFLKMYQLK